MAAVIAVPSPWLAKEDRQRADEQHASRELLARADAIALLVDRRLDRIADLYRERLEDRRAIRGS